MSVDVNLDDYVLAGYFITKYMDRPGWQEADPFPRRLLTAATTNLVDIVVRTKYLPEWQSIFDKFGITPDMEPIISAWEQDHLGEIGWPAAFCSLETARDYARLFIADTEDVVILGVALPEDEADEFLSSFEEIDPRIKCDTVSLIANRVKPLTGKPLGFEMLDFDYGTFDLSWVVWGFEYALREEIGLELNKHGFLNSREEAIRIDRYMDEDADLKIHGPWSYWLIIKYPLEGEA